MIPSFKEFLQLNEGLFTFKDSKLQNKTFEETKEGFKKLGYEYLGMLCVTTRMSYNQFCPKEIEDSLQETLWDMEKEIFGEYRTSTPLDIYYASKRKEVDPRIYDFTKRENVCHVKYKDGGKIFCFWNPGEKYYYFIKLRKRQTRRATIYLGESPEVTVFNKWASLKHDGIEAVRKDYLQQKKDEDEREEELRKRIEAKRKEEERVEGIKKKVIEMEEKILNDAKENPDDYVEIKHLLDIPTSEIPKDIQLKIFHNEYSNEEKLEVGWFKVRGEQLTARDPYERADYMYYLVNKDFTKKYKYKCEVSFARPGTYWGD